MGPHWPVNQNAELGKYHVFSSSETVFLRWNALKSDLKYLFKHIFRGELLCQKLKSQINENFEKCPKINNQIDW